MVRRIVLSSSVDRQHTSRVLGPAAFLAAAVLALAGCTSGKATSTDTASATPAPSFAGSPMCNFLGQLNETAAQATSQDAGLAALAELEPQLEQVSADAPAAARSDLLTVVTAAKDAISTKDLSALATDQVAQAGSRLAAQCGLAANGPVPFATATR